MRKTIKDFKLPENLTEILNKEELWEDESFSPLSITIEPTSFKGKDLISYQLEINAGDFPGIEHLLTLIKKEPNGYSIRDLILQLILKDKIDVTKIHDDSELSTCILWSEDYACFEEILTAILELIGDTYQKVSIPFRELVDNQILVYKTLPKDNPIVQERLKALEYIANYFDKNEYPSICSDSVNCQLNKSIILELLHDSIGYTDQKGILYQMKELLEIHCMFHNNGKSRIELTESEFKTYMEFFTKF